MFLCAPPSTILSPLHPSFPSRRGTRRAPTSKDFSQRNLVATKLDFDLTYPLHFLLFRSLHPSSLLSPLLLPFLLFSRSFFAFSFVLVIAASLIRCIRPISYLLYFTFHPFSRRFLCSLHSNFFILHLSSFFSMLLFFTAFAQSLIPYILPFISIPITSVLSHFMLFPAFYFSLLFQLSLVSLHLFFRRFSCSLHSNFILYTSSFILFLDASFLRCIRSIFPTFYFSLLFQLSLVSLLSFFSTLSLFSAFEFLYTSPFILFLDAFLVQCIRISHSLYFTFHPFPRCFSSSLHSQNFSFSTLYFSLLF